MPISNLTLEFEPDLNVPVVPNNVGKTAVVNALRALLGATTLRGRQRCDLLVRKVKQLTRAAQVRRYTAEAAHDTH
jgi:predicted ATP-dependent endonuclease of OLD family